MSERDIRRLYQIPEDMTACFLDDGRVMFSYCDEDITVDLQKGTATYTWLGCDVDGHYTGKMPWRQNLSWLNYNHNPES
jgi:hypothetical protein